MNDWLLGPKAWLPSVLDSVQVRNVLGQADQKRSLLDPTVLLVQLELWARETLLGGVS